MPTNLVNEAFDLARVAHDQACVVYHQARAALSHAITIYNHARTDRDQAKEAYDTICEICEKTAQGGEVLALASIAYSRANHVFGQADTAHNQAWQVRDKASAVFGQAHDTYYDAWVYMKSHKN